MENSKNDGLASKKRKAINMENITRVWFHPINTLKHIGAHKLAFISGVGDFFFKKMNIKLKSFMTPHEDIREISIDLSESDLIELKNTYSAEEFSKIYPFDVIHCSVKDATNTYVLTSYLNGEKLSESRICDSIMDSLDLYTLSLNHTSKFSYKAKDLLSKFNDDWNYFSITKGSVHIDFEKICDKGEIKDLVKLYEFCHFGFTKGELASYPEVGKILKSGVPLGFIFHAYEDYVSKKDMVDLINLSSEHPETFYLPGNESAYSQDFVATFKACKARLKMEEMFSDDGLKSTKRKVV